MGVLRVKTAGLYGVSYPTTVPLVFSERIRSHSWTAPRHGGHGTKLATKLAPLDRKVSTGLEDLDWAGRSAFALSAGKPPLLRVNTLNPGKSLVEGSRDDLSETSNQSRKHFKTLCSLSFLLILHRISPDGYEEVTNPLGELCSDSNPPCVSRRTTLRRNFPILCDRTLWGCRFEAVMMDTRRQIRRLIQTPSETERGRKVVGRGRCVSSC